MGHYSKEDVSSWEQGTKRCNVCQEIRPLSAFSKNKKCLLSVNNACRSCANPTGRGFTRFTLEEELAWPIEHRGCVICREVKPFEEFHKHDACRWGVNTTCKDCRKNVSKVGWKRNRKKIEMSEELLKKTMLRGAKARATRGGYPFNIDASDIIIPAKCPVLGVELVYCGGPSSPSLDKIDPTLGYVKGNVMVISNKANTMKNNATKTELRNFCEFYLKML